MLEKTASSIDKFQILFGRVVAWLTLGMVLAMFFSVMQRYLFQANLIWQQELVRYMHGMVFLLAAGYTLKRDEHVRVDVLYQRFSARTKAAINLFGTIIFLFPVCIALVYFSFDFVVSSWEIMESSPEYGGLPGRFLFKSCIWVFAATLMLQGISIICRSLITLRGQE